MRNARRFSSSELEALTRARILGVRSGDAHRYTGVWVVVVEGRAFVRSWGDAPSGWYRSFLDEPLGSISIGEVEIPVRARPTRSPRLRQAVSRAFAEKYPTKGSRKWVVGFAEPQREAATLELLPR